MAFDSVPVAAARTNRSYFRHGLTHHPLYPLWAGMIDRCTKPWHKSFPEYGGRGIRIAVRWMNFKNFLDDMGERPSLRHSVERVDNDGNYCPENCRWATKREQQNNTRRCRRLTCGAVTLTVTQWARETGLALTTIRRRISYGWPDEKVLTKIPRSVQPTRVGAVLRLPVN